MTKSLFAYVNCAKYNLIFMTKKLQKNIEMVKKYKKYSIEKQIHSAFYS